MENLFCQQPISEGFFCRADATWGMCHLCGGFFCQPHGRSHDCQTGLPPFFDRLDALDALIAKGEEND